MNYGNVHPTRYSISTTPSLSDLSSFVNKTITLSLSAPLLTLDYGKEVAGFPYFHISALSDVSQIEVAYAEEFDTLSEPESDGPWTFSNGLSNTFRVETFNITKQGYFESFFIQGGQRWESVRLLTNSTITIDGVGFRSTSQTTKESELPGHLSTDNEVYNRIFDLGGHVAQVACVDAGNAPSTWEITNDGALVRGQASAQSTMGGDAANYTLNFDTKIVRGGTGWRIGAGRAPIGPYFVLTSKYPTGHTFVNTNRTLLPPNTLIFNPEWSLVNQTSLTVFENSYYPLNVSIDEDRWYHISTAIEEKGYRVQLDGKDIVFVPLPSPSLATMFSASDRYQGTWGFGGYQDHISYFKEVSVTAKNGTDLYYNAMTAENTLAEYSVAPLEHSLCLDGAKRDRLVWIGDFYHTVRVVALSTARAEFILGTLDFVFGFQSQQGSYAGFVPISPSLGSRPQYQGQRSNQYAGLIDYQDLFLAGIGQYFRYSGDVDALRPYWGQIKKLATAKMAFIDPNSGLVAGSPAVPAPFSFLGPANGTAVTGLFAFTLEGLSVLAKSLKDEEAATLYAQTASSLRTAMNMRLWNDKLGTYSLSLSSPGNFSLTGIAWSILSGAANATQAASSIAKLEELRFGVGYRTTSSDEESEDYQLAPNPSGFLLEALFKSQRDYGTNSAPAISHLLNNLWGSMVNNEQYYSGASWEYVKPDGSPGLDFYTSLAHPWGAAPTYVLPAYLAGIEPASPGYQNFTINPMVGYLGLLQVDGRAPTPYGPIEVAWTVSDKKAVVEISSPEGTTGRLQVPRGAKLEVNSSVDGYIDLPHGKTQVVLVLE